MWITNIGQYSFTVNWDSHGSNVSKYNLEVRQGSTIVKSAYGISSGARSYGVNGLNPDSTYEVKLYSKTSSNATVKVEYSYPRTASPPPPKPGGVGSIYTSPSENSIYISWSSASYADHYCVEVRRSHSSGQMDYSNYFVYGTSVTATGLISDQNYWIKVYAVNSSGNGTPSYTTDTTTRPIPPEPPIAFKVDTRYTDGFYTSWIGHSSAKEGYFLEVYRNGSFVKSYSIGYGGSTCRISGLAEYTSYDLKIYAKRLTSGGHTSDPVWLYNQYTKDGTPPSVTITNSNGNGTLYFAWSASDSGSGIRNSNKYAVAISSANGSESTLKHKEYTNNNYYTFTTDADGLTYTQNAYYYLRVTAYDNDGNDKTATIRVQFKRLRPNSWEWHTQKSKGSPINLTAVEWNSFCTKINQFRQYKFLNNYSFTNVSRGSQVKADYVNQAVLAIRSMSPSTSPPATVSKGSDCTADFFNRLRNSLNSIQ